MADRYCQVCLGRFSENLLLDGLCESCRELQKIPRPQAPVFYAEDIDYQGPQKNYWFPVVSVVVLCVLVFMCWPQKREITLEGIQQIDTEALIEDLSDEGEFNEEFVKKLMLEKQNEVIETLLLIEKNRANKDFVVAITKEIKSFYQYSINFLNEDDFEVRANPRSLFSRHYLLLPKSDIYYNDEIPASSEDDTIERPREKVKK